MVAEEFANGFLRDDVQADGGFVEKKDFRFVEQGSDQLHFHAFAEGKLADHDVQLLFYGEERGEFIDGSLETIFVDAVDAGVEFERFTGGQIPPELIFLSEQQSELAAVAVLAFPGSEAKNFGGTAGGVKKAGEHFERGGFAGAVRAEETNQLPLPYRKADILGGGNGFVVALPQTFKRAAKSRSFFVGAVNLGQRFDLNDGPIAFHRIEIRAEYRELKKTLQPNSCRR